MEFVVSVEKLLFHISYALMRRLPISRKQKKIYSFVGACHVLSPIKK